ncbi:MAG: AzlC family ABC transporter permease [Nitriliruptoraceae bacterium]
MAKGRPAAWHRRRTHDLSADPVKEQRQGADDASADPGATPTSSTRSLFVLAIPVALAVGAYGLSYGVLAVAAGLSPAVATLSSLLVLAGGSQFAFVGVLALGGNPFAGAVSGLLLNVRYVAFGLAIARALPAGSLRRRAVDSYLIVDESVALALGKAGPMPSEPSARQRWSVEVVRRFRVVGWSVVIAWIATTALGAYGGRLIADPEVFGLDAAFPAGFLALLAPWLRTARGRIAAAIGVLLALGLTPIAPPGVPIIAASLGGVVALWLPLGPERRRSA